MMKFHEMKRKDLQSLCKKHGIPANLKNIEMATRLASLLQKESEEIVVEENVSCEDSVEDDGVKSKKVSFSPETEVFEFTRSVKKRRQTKNVQGPARDLQRGDGIEIRRSRRIGSSVATQEGSKVAELKGLCRNVQDGSKVGKVGRRSTRQAANISISDRLVVIDDKEDEVQDVQGDAKVEKVPRRSKRFVSDIYEQTDTQDQRRSVRVKAIAANHSMGGGTFDGKGSKEERKSKQPKEQVSSQEGEPLNVGMVTRRSKRNLNKVDVPLVDEKAPKQSSKLEKSGSELLFDGQAQQGAKKLKRTSGNDHDDIKLLRRSKRTALDNTMGQAMSNSPSRCSNAASVEKESNENDEMKARVRCTRKYLKNGSFKAAKVAEGNLVGKKTDETLVKPSKRVTRRMKRDVSAELGIGVETASTQGNLMPEEHLDEHTQFDQEEAVGTSVEARGSSPSSTKTKAAEPVMIILDSTPEKSDDSSQKTNTQELDAELMERESEEKLEQHTVLMDVLEEEKETGNEEVSSGSIRLIERLSPGSVQLAVSSPEVGLLVPTFHTLLKDIASTLTVEEKTKDEILRSTPRPELSVAMLAEVEATMENSAECLKEIHLSKEDGKGSSEKEVQGANLHGNFSECNTENSNAEEEMDISKVGCMSAGHCVNVTPEKLSDEHAQLEPEEAEAANVEARSSSKKMKAVNQEFVNDEQQGMADNSPSTSETKATDPVMISENVLDSTLKVSGDTSGVRSNQELNSELMERECENKLEQDSVLIAGAKKEKEEASSLSEFLSERSEVKTCPDNSSTGCYLSLDTTPHLASVEPATSNPEAEIGMPTGHTLVKDIVSTVIIEEDIKTKDELLISTPRSEFKEHSSVSKLAKAEATLEISAECCKETRSSNNDEKGALEKDRQATNLHENFFECNTETTSAEEQAEISKVGCSVNLQTLDKVKDASLDESELISTDEGCKLEIRGCSSPDFASPSTKEENISECFEKDEIKALSQPLLVSKAASSSLDDSAVFTTPERNLMLTEQLSENGKTCGADPMTHHNDEAVVSCAVVLTTPEQVLLMEDAGIDKSDIAITPLRQSTMGDFKADGTERNEENKTFELHCQNRYALLENSVSDVAVNSGGNKVMEFCEASAVPNILFLEDAELAGEAKSEEAAEEHSPLDTGEGTKGDNITVKSHVASDICTVAESPTLVRDYAPDDTEEKYRENNDESEPQSAEKQSRKELEFNDESISAMLESRFLLGQSGQERLGTGKSGSSPSQYQSHLASSPKVISNDDGNSQTENVASPDSTQGTSKQSRWHSPHVDSVNVLDFDIERAEAVNDAEISIGLSSYVLALPAKGTCETIGEISNHLEVAETCSMVSGDRITSSANIQNQISSALEELSITDELIEPKAISGLEDEATGPIATASDEEMIKQREATPSPEQTLNKDLNIDRSSKLSEKQVKREPTSIYTTQVKPKRLHHDMKENAPNSKIVNNLNVTAPRTSKRKPLQVLRKN